MEQALLESSTGRLLDLPLYSKSVAAGRCYLNLFTEYILYIILRGCAVRAPLLDNNAANVQFMCIQSEKMGIRRNRAWYYMSALQLGFIYIFTVFFSQLVTHIYYWTLFSKLFTQHNWSQCLTKLWITFPCFDTKCNQWPPLSKCKNCFLTQTQPQTKLTLFCMLT